MTLPGSGEEREREGGQTLVWGPSPGAAQDRDRGLWTHTRSHTHTQRSAHTPATSWDVSEDRTGTWEHPSLHHAATSCHQNRGPMNQKLVEKDRSYSPSRGFTALQGWAS